ncbi:MAG: endonuclease [Firmicutes bacterium]|nr:endonuclease [Bacillota bacterium]
MANSQNRYSKLIESIFYKYYKEGIKEITFEREELISTAKELKIELPKNLGDVLYSFRYRATLPDAIVRAAPDGLEWVIRPVGKSRYMFSLSDMPRIVPSKMLVETKIPDATPGIINKYAFDDEQGLLAKLRYNRLIDIFTGITCYSLQNHLRTTVPEIGQIETDELYVGLDKKGVHYILPVQAKGGTDQLGIVQIEQDFAMCQKKFPSLICIPIAAQFIDKSLIALFSFELSEKGVSISSEKHYRLVDPKDLSEKELEQYKQRSE